MATMSKANQKRLDKIMAKFHKPFWCYSTVRGIIKGLLMEIQYLEADHYIAKRNAFFRAMKGARDVD